MMSGDIKCVFCGETAFEKIIIFSAETLKKCLTVLEYRRCKPVFRKSRTKYDKVRLSPYRSLSEGYHAKCYKLFTAIKVPPNFQNFEQKSIVKYENDLDGSRESDESDSPSNSTTHAAGTPTNEFPAQISHNLEHFVEADDQFWLNKPCGKINLQTAKCFICEKTRKIQNGCEIPLSVNKLRTTELLMNVATQHNDTQMLEKLTSITNYSSTFYHKCCKDQYLKDLSGVKGDSIKRKEASNTAYTLLCKMLEERVVDNNECMLYEYVKEEYQQLLEEQFKLLSETITITFSDGHLERKLMDTFKYRIQLVYANSKKFLAPITDSI